MARRYSSFLIRYWRLAGDKQRIEIEHIQSGDRMRAASLAAVMAWIDSQHGDLESSFRQGESAGDGPLDSLGPAELLDQPG